MPTQSANLTVITGAFRLQTAHPHLNPPPVKGEEKTDWPHPPFLRRAYTVPSLWEVVSWLD